MSLYTRRLTREQAQARFEVALSRMPARLAEHFRQCVDFGEPAEGALWLREWISSGGNGTIIGAIQDASLALLGYHNTLVAESIAAKERAAHEAEEKARATDDDDVREWATREQPTERIDDVTADEIREQR